MRQEETMLRIEELVFYRDPGRVSWRRCASLRRTG